MLESDIARDDLTDRLDWLLVNLRLADHGELSDDEITRQVSTFSAVQRRIAARARDGESPLMRMQQRLHLSDSEVVVLTLLAGVELSPDIRAHVMTASGGAAAGVTRERIRCVVYGTAPSREAMRELGANGRLRKLGLIERCDSARDTGHESHHAWTLATRVLELLLGDDAPSESVPGRILRARGAALDGLAISPEALREVRRAVATDALAIVAGLPATGRRTVLAAAANEVGREVLEIDVSRLAHDASRFERELREIARECVLLERTPLLVNVDALAMGDERLAIMCRDLERLIDGPVLATCGLVKPRLEWARAVIVVDLPPITAAQRATLWRDALGDEDAAPGLANDYPLAPGLIVRVADAAKARAGERPVARDDVRAAVRAVLDERLGHYCKRLVVTQTWDDIVLSSDHINMLVELLSRVRSRSKVYEDWGFAAKVGRGLGVAALFSGPPGTGKTMVAGLVAQDLGLEIYQVDMSKIVSKFIGETEKHLAAVFDAAESGHAILLFDEADALFGKRTDVRSSNDRYANLETNFLLQRLESFTGICILTTNHDTHIDPAFQRRLSQHVRFELPDEAERARMWRATLPATVPLAPDVDFESIAQRYVMSGGYIRNAALRAAFLAADEDSPITRLHLERSARREYEGMGKIAA
jgi:hypothetical protein